MARKKKETITPEQLEEANLSSELNELRKNLHLIPSPTKVLNIGDEVAMGSLEDVIIEDVLEDGKIYLIDYTRTDNNYGNPIVSKNKKMYVKWLDVRLKNNNRDSLVQNEDLRLSYSQTHLTDVFSKAYYFGIDFEPDYQRDYVWELNDKVELIDSIFNNVDIGKFVYVRIDDEKWRESGYKYSYEVLDGKQRIRAILDYYEDRFPYKGKYYSDLSPRDRSHIKNYSINVAEVSGITEEDALRYFVKLNTTGKAMDKEHLDKVKQRLEEISK